MYTKIGSRGVAALMMLTLILTLGHGAFAQTAEGSLHGVVEDQLGAVIVGATVTATDVAGATTTAVTDSRGVYLFQRLASATYKISATAPGFSPTEVSDVEIAAGRR